jgi:thiamine-monophosphate kinase
MVLAVAARCIDRCGKTNQTMSEFDLIKRYFAQPVQALAAHPQVLVGIGDDCAVLQPTPGMQLAVSSDMLVEGRHFLSTVAPDRLGHKALAVNLSDLAACGARPLGFTLALALPQADEAWLAGFAQGLFALADAHHCPLVGGDTTRGPLNICITVFGEVPPGQALLRSGAQPGDELWVSGTLGDARLALEVFRGTLAMTAPAFAAARARMETPTPRVALGLALRGVATSAIDISDGLLGDLGHVLRASQVGAVIDSDVASQLIANYDGVMANNGVSSLTLLDCILAGGDDYELAFTAPLARHAEVLAAGKHCGTRVTCIGRIEAQPGLRLLDGAGREVVHTYRGFDHFG